MSSVVTAATTSSWLVTEWKFVFGLVCVLLCGVWIWRRTGSTHVFIALLWRRLLVRRDGVRSPLDTFLEERDELIRFRALTGLKGVPTLAAAQRIADWTRLHDLDIDRVSTAQAFVDLRTPALRQPKLKRWAVGLIELASGLLLVGAVYVTAIGASTPAVVRVLQTDTWYKVSVDRSRRLESLLTDSAPAFARRECADQAAVVKRTQYSTYDVDVLCTLMTDEGGIGYLRDVQVAQWLGTVAIVVGLAVLGWLCRIVYRGAEAAIELIASIQTAPHPTSAQQSAPKASD